MLPDHEKRPSVTVRAAHSEEPAVAPISRSILLRRLPLAACFELLAAIALTVSGAILVACLNGHLQWGSQLGVVAGYQVPSISPQTILSLIHSAVTLLVGIALKDGITIAWWRKATNGSTVKDLDHRYQAGSSVKSALLAGKSFGWIAVATISATVLGFSQGSLMQSSLNVRQSSIKSTIDINTTVATVLPDGYTGRITGHDSYFTTFLRADFNDVIHEFNQAIPITPTGFSGCTGTCRSTIRAAGLAPDCTVEQTPITIKEQVFCPNGTSQTCSTTGTPYQLFQARFDYASMYGATAAEIEASKAYPYITLEVSYIHTGPSENANSTHQSAKGETQTLALCPGQNYTHTCTLRPAILEYPVIIQNNTIQSDTITLNSGSSSLLNVVEWINITFPDWSLSTIGGVQLALNELYQSELTVTYIPTSSTAAWSPYIHTGTLAENSLNWTQSNGRSMENFLRTCQVGFNNPVPMILNAVNEIMFRTALMAAITNGSLSDSAVYPAQQDRDVNKYTANFYYLAASIAVTVLCIALMLPTFWGYWTMSHKMTLNPIELAEAFNAPVLRKEGEHRNLDELMRAVGEREVQYAPVEVQLPDGVTTIVRRAMIMPESK